MGSYLWQFKRYKDLLPQKLFSEKKSSAAGRDQFLMHPPHGRVEPFFSEA